MPAWMSLAAVVAPRSLAVATAAGLLSAEMAALEMGESSPAKTEAGARAMNKTKRKNAIFIEREHRLTAKAQRPERSAGSLERVVRRLSVGDGQR